MSAPSSTSRRRRSWLARIALAVCGPLVFLGLVEGTLRLLTTTPEDHHQALYEGTPLATAPSQFRWDPDLMWRAVADRDWGEGHRINSAGFRGPDRELAKDPGTYRVACLGDSVTFGWSLPDGETYPRVLEELLNRSDAGTRFEVFNFGVPGYTTHQGLLLLEHDVLAYQPDVVTFLFGWNDNHYSTLGCPDREWPRPNAVMRLTLGLAERLRTFQVLRRLLLRWNKPEPPGVGGEGLEEDRLRVPPDVFAANVVELVRRTREAGATPFLVTEPHNFKYVDYPIHLRYERLVRRVSARQGAPLVDFAGKARRSYLSSYVFLVAMLCNPVLPDVSRWLVSRINDDRQRTYRELAGETCEGPVGVPDRELFIDAVHLNKEGHLLLAYMLYDRLRQTELPELPPRSPSFFVNLGQVSSRDAWLPQILGPGWGEAHPPDAWRWWRPLAAREASLEMVLCRGDAGRLRIRCKTTTGRPEVRLAVACNGHPLGSQRLATQWTTLSFEASAGQWRRGRNVVLLRLEGIADGEAEVLVASVLAEQDIPPR